MATAFSFKRPERNPWLLVIPLLLLAFLIWSLAAPSRRPSPVQWVVLAAMAGHWAWRQWRFHKLPLLSLEIDEQEIRLLPSSHWGIDPIPRSSVNGVREERSSMFVLYKRNGNDKAIELERHFFDKAAWQQLLELLQPLPSKKSAEAAAGIR